MLRIVSALLAVASAMGGIRSVMPPLRDPTAVLAHARRAMGVQETDDRVIHFHAVFADQQNYQSDRTYPPFFDAMTTAELWFHAGTGIERVVSETTFPGGGAPPSTSIYSGEGGFLLGKSGASRVAQSQLRIRDLNAWAVIVDWSHADHVRAGRDEMYRDYPRIVLTRRTDAGDERLLLDEKTGFPVKLEYEEPHYLWGQRRIEYLYSNWTQAGPIQVNASAFRLADGDVEISATIGDVNIEKAEAAPSLSMPPMTSPADAVSLFLQATPPTVVRVGTSTALLVNPGYTEAITRVGDDVWIFDATQGERRAQRDAEAIAALFPGSHHINVIVTDLAWPHVAGVRYWVAQGATIVAHSAARSFLQRVVDRKWTREPDALERRRGVAKFNFVGIDARRPMAGGSVIVAPIDGIGSEVALIGYLPTDRFLWASDYIQTVSEPSAYVTDVWSAVQRAHFDPLQTAAQHMALTPWTVISGLARGAPR
jgi:hypothetical protein